MGEGKAALWRNAIISGGLWNGLLWGVELSPEHAILEAVGAPPEYLALVAGISLLAVVVTIWKSVYYMGLLGLFAWLFGAMGGYAWGVGDPPAGLLLIVLAEMCFFVGIGFYGPTSTWHEF